MSKSSQRRQRKLARYLRNLAEKNPRAFKVEWGKRLESWLDEIQIISRDCRRSHSDLSETKIFTVLDRANTLLGLCGDRAEALVGSHTRQILNEVCCRQFALAANPQLHRLGNSHRNYLLMKSGTHKPPR